MTARDFVRITTLNLWSAPSASEAEGRLRAAADDVARRRPDVLCLQEVALFDDDTSTADALAEMCGMRVAVQGVFARKSVSAHGRNLVRPTGCAILTSLTSSVPWPDLSLPHSGGVVHGAVVAELTSATGRPWLVGSTRLAWGGNREPERQAQVTGLELFFAKAEHRRAAYGVAVLCGDFNAAPDTDAVRFLTGRAALGGAGAYWVDAWEVAGDGAGFTSEAANSWARTQASWAGIADPTQLPGRRIDYAMVRGWVHGRPGGPLAARLAFTEPGADGTVASDHWGVETDLWDPPL